MRELVPVLGRDDISDRVGMGIAITTLNASLRKGKYTNHLQWDTMRKNPTWYTNAFEAGEEFSSGAIFSNQDKKSYESTAPTASRWFTRFMLGAKRRMGVIRRQDEALTVRQLMGILDIAEEDWQASSCLEEKKDIESVMAFMIIGFCVSLRGEEVPLVVIEGMLTFWEETKDHEIPHMMITLKGKFKGENNLRWHCVPLADHTKSKIPTRRWISRLLQRRVLMEGKRSGYLFARKNNGKATLGDYDPLFRDYVVRAQKKISKTFFGGSDHK